MREGRGEGGPLVSVVPDSVVLSQQQWGGNCHVRGPKKELGVRTEAESHRGAEEGGPRRAGGESCALCSPRARCGFISDTQSLHTSEVLGPSRLRGAVSFPVKMQGSQGRKAFSVLEKTLKLGRRAAACTPSSDPLYLAQGCPWLLTGALGSMVCGPGLWKVLILCGRAWPTEICRWSPDPDLVSASRFSFGANQTLGPVGHCAVGE